MAPSLRRAGGVLGGSAAHSSSSVKGRTMVLFAKLAAGLADPRHYRAVMAVNCNACKTEGVTGAALYKPASRMNHACEPTAKVVCSFTDSTIDVVATRDVARGEELTLSYVDPSVGDHARRRRTLRDCYGFDCQCIACRKSNHE